MPRFSIRLNALVSAEIGGAPPFSQLASLVLIRWLMSNVSHDFVSVDMRGLKAALVARARSLRVGVSTIVRGAVTRELGLPVPPGPAALAEPAVPGKTVKVSIRLSSVEAAQLAAGAREAGLSRGAYVAGLVGGVAVLSGRADHVAALTASCGELAMLSRNIHHLTTLLRQGSARAVQEYLEMLDSLAAEVRRHLKVAADALADLRPKHAVPAEPRRTPTVEKQHA